LQDIFLTNLPPLFKLPPAVDKTGVNLKIAFALAGPFTPKTILFEGLIAAV
jgi:hypothetical protein